MTIQNCVHIERVLFLVERIPRRKQGLAAFKEYLPNEPSRPKAAEKLIAKDRRIYIAIYPARSRLWNSYYHERHEEHEEKI